MIKWYYSRLIRKAVKMSDWKVALRKNRDTIGILNKDIKDEFISVSNTETHWFADPMLFSYNGVTWLFVEAFNKNRKLGEIGVFKVNDDCAVCDYQTIIQLNCHMSYPFVFEYKDDIFMVPETGANKCIYLYKSIEFPYKWEKIGILAEGKAYRDSTIYRFENQLYLFTYQRTDNRRLFHTYECYLYRMNLETCSLELIENYADVNAVLRPAGFVSYQNHSLIHVTQKCNRIYGESLMFWKSNDSFSWKNSQLIGQIDGCNININDKHPILTHTYTCTNEYEVIDYRTLK